MIIVRLNGGLGNQMFQVALYKVLQAMGKEVKLDRFKYTQFDEKRKCILDYDCFQFEYDICSRKEARKFVLGTGMLARFFMRFLGDKKTHIYELAEYQYDPTVLQAQEGYLDGFWQTWKYMEDHKEVIKDTFHFVQNLSTASQNVLQEIGRTNSVAVHIRRGDYVRLDNIYGNICTLDYYKKAIAKMEELTANPQFFFFSDDIEWVIQNFQGNEKYHFVGNDEEKEDYEDMQLMSSCCHQIIANSSFSWWSAYLNAHEDKVVICPSKWINGKDTTDIFMNEWIRL